MKVICCEASGDWAVAIRRKLPSSVSLVETRSLAELADRVQESPSAMVSIEWSAAKAEAMLAEIARIARKYPHAVVIVLANRDPLCPELACREAGATPH